MWGLAAVGLAAAWGRSENVGDAIGITTRSGNCYFFATHPGGIAIACRPVTIGVPFGMWTFPMPSEVAGRHWITFRWVDQVYSTRERYADLGAFPPGWKQPPPWAPVRWPPPQHGWAGLGWSSVASVPGPWPLRVGHCSVDVPYFAFGFPLALAGLWLAYRALRGCRRLRAGLCPTCGYDLRATPGRCPECGVNAMAGRA
jgi:hypothetical protein